MRKYGVQNGKELMAVWRGENVQGLCRSLAKKRIRLVWFQYGTVFGKLLHLGHYLGTQQATCTQAELSKTSLSSPFQPAEPRLSDPGT